MARQIVIVGCGRLGGVLANALSGAGHSVVVVDRRESAFDKLNVNFSGFRIIGDVVEHEILKKARLEEADYCFTVTKEDNTNLMIAQVARDVFNVPNVIARVYDPEREAIYKSFGIKTISPIQLTSVMFLKAVE